MAKFIVQGDKTAYIMEAETQRLASYYADKELKYGKSGNTKVLSVTYR